MAVRSRVDRYEIVRKLGAGANAKVKLALDTVTGNQVALKIMKGDPGSIPRRYLAQCQTEIQALNALSHPNVVRIYGVSENAQYESKSGRIFPVVYIAMELLSHGELFDVLYYTGKMEEPLARVYFRQVIEAVQACHDQGITHRDLKPENILFDENFNLKLADFGFAAPAGGRDGSGLLRTFLGTEVYMAPELLKSQAYSGTAVDIFACGVILFILVSQHPAFGKATTIDRYYSLFQRDNSGFWALHSKSKPAGFYSPEFQDLINKLLAAESEDRPTVAQVLEHPWLGGESLSVERAQAEVALRWRKAQEKKAAQERRTVRGQAGYRDQVEAGDREWQLPVYASGTEKFSRLFLTLSPNAILHLLKTFLNDKSAEVTQSDTKAKLKAQLASEEEVVSLSVKLYEAGELGVCVDVTKHSGPAYAFMRVFEELSDHFEQAVEAEA